MHGLGRVQVDGRVVVQDPRVMRRDVAHAAHVGRERVHLVHFVGGAVRVLRLTQIDLQELVGGRRGVFRLLRVDAAHPIAALFQKADEMVADEAARAGDEHARHPRFLAIGMRHPVPNARSVTFNPGGACLRLNSAIWTRRSTCATVAGSNPAATISSAGWCRSTWRSRMSSSTSYGGSES